MEHVRLVYLIESVCPHSPLINGEMWKGKGGATTIENKCVMLNETGVGDWLLRKKNLSRRKGMGKRRESEMVNGNGT